MDIDVSEPDDQIARKTRQTERRRGDSENMKRNVSRRNFVQSSALIAAACATASAAPTISEPSHASGKPSPIHLGMASYTFRNFSRTQLIGFMKQLNLTDLNAKDVKDHLPMDPVEEAKALVDYAAAGIKLHAAGTIYFPKDEDDDIRSKFEYCKRAGISVIVAGDPTPQILPRIEKFVKAYDIRFAIHNHGPEDKVWPSPLDVLKAVEHLDPRMGCCIDVGHTVRAGTDVVQAIHEVGPRLFDMHMKDLTSFQSKESQVAVGDGIMPVREIFEALVAIRYKGFVDLEYEIHGDDPMPGVSISFAYMRGVLTGMGYANNG
jgi:sugar phosphate isomerase/epimerase